MKTKSFLINGAGSYLAKAITTLLANDEGTRVFLTSRKTYDLQVLDERKDWRYLPGIDLLIEEDIKKLSDAVSDFFPEKFHVINCVGGYWDHFPFDKLSLAGSQKTINDNLITVFNVAYFFMPIMAKRNGGHFITFGCNSTRHHYPYMTPFTVAKAGIATMMKCLASEYAKYNIQCNCFLLATIKNNREHQTKPFGDYENWLDPIDIAEIVINVTQVKAMLMNGSEIELWKYSEQYNWEGYFQRIRKTNTKIKDQAETSISDLKISKGTYNLLKKVELTTLEGIAQHSEEELLKFRFFGQRALKEVKKLLAQNNLSLKLN